MFLYLKILKNHFSNQYPIYLAPFMSRRYSIDIPFNRSLHMGDSVFQSDSARIENFFVLKTLPINGVFL